MARSFKISFPLPHRRSASPATTPGSQYSKNSYNDDSPLSHPGTKAQRMLGTSEPDLTHLKKQKSGKERKQLRKQSSFISFTLSDIDGESAVTPDEFPFPGMYKANENSGRPSHNLSRKPSSALFGDQYPIPAVIVQDDASDSSSPQARGALSSPISTQYYDPAKTPLSVSQQTSASSVRDMALRKGLPPISGPLNEKIVLYGNDTESHSLPARKLSGDLKVSGNSKISANSIISTHADLRQGPSINDPPTLYPNVAHNLNTRHAVSPPPALIGTSLPKHLRTNHQSILSDRPKWWRKKSSPKQSSSVEPDSIQNNESFAESFSSIKVNVKKPKSHTSGERNWFDGLEDESDPAMEDLQHPEVLQHYLSTHLKPPMGIFEVMAQVSPSPQTPIWKSSIGNKSQHTTYSDRKLRFRVDTTPSQHVDKVPSSPPLELRADSYSPKANSAHSARLSKAAPTRMDLLKESFLELSSSEDEDCDSSTLSEGPEPHHRHRIRASIERINYNHEVIVGDAQSIQHVRPRSIAKRHSSRSSGKSSQENIPPVPKIPDKPKLSQCNSSNTWRDVRDRRSTSTESMIGGRKRSLPECINTQGMSWQTRAEHSACESKLMKVTADEEKLLEAMRDKRASIRQDDFANGFKTAMQLQDLVTRPKTSGADGHTFRTPMYGSRSLIPDPSLQEYDIKKALDGSRLSASTDDLRLEEAYPFPEVPPSLKGAVGFVPQSKASPSVSFSPSDILPSTPTSLASPVTPPSGQSALIGYGRFTNALSPSKDMIVLDKLGHRRKRTMSSNIAMLDGSEQHALLFDEKNDIPGWAIERW